MHLRTELPRDTAVDRRRRLVGASPICAKLAEAVCTSTGGSVRAVEEFWIPASHERADLVVVNGSLAAYEIKSARDRLDRLPRQVSAFSKIFDHCTLVVAERHFERALPAIPEWWGLMVAADVEPARVFPVRDSKENPGVDTGCLVRLLWRAEVSAALAMVSPTPPDPTASRARLWRTLLERCDLGELRRVVREALLARPVDAGRIPRKGITTYDDAMPPSSEASCSTTTAR